LKVRNLPALAVLVLVLVVSSPALAIYCGIDRLVGRGVVHFEMVGQRDVEGLLPIVGESIIVVDVIVGRVWALEYVQIVGQALVAPQEQIVGQATLKAQDLLGQAVVEPQLNIVGRTPYGIPVVGQSPFTPPNVVGQESSCDDDR